ncbi:MAG: PAS domain-containing protein [Paracoccaceae bacterium]
MSAARASHPSAAAMDDVEARLAIDRSKVAMVITNPALDDNPIIYVNDAFEQMTGYARSAAVGRNCRFLQGEETERAHVARMARAIDAVDDIGIDLLNYTAAGEPFLNRLMITPILGADGAVQYYLGIQRRVDRAADLTAGGTAQADGQLARIQGLVKEQLGLVIGLIRSQSTAPGDLSAPAEFAALARRVEILQLLHEELAHAEAGDRPGAIPLGTYLGRIVSAIGHLDGRAGIRVTSSLDAVDAGVDVASRLGLILSETLTNAFRHAFRGLDRGLLEIRLSALAEGGLRLTVADDGVGIPRGVDWPSRDTAGGRVIDGLIEGLSGTLNVMRGAAGTVVTVDVPVGSMDS